MQWEISSASLHTFALEGKHSQEQAAGGTEETDLRTAHFAFLLAQKAHVHQLLWAHW